MKKQTRFVSVWDAIEDTPQRAASMRARSELMMALQGWVKTSGNTQAKAAKLFGITQPSHPLSVVAPCPIRIRAWHRRDQPGFEVILSAAAIFPA